jgi:glutamate-1-semialdehyde aminotransferase
MSKVLNNISNGSSLWSKAKSIIPGGNGLLSKRPDRYAKDLWPVYFSKAKGCHIWDLDGNVYIDMAENGIGTAILGYADDDVNQSVIDAIHNGVNTTLNAPEEVELAQKLLELNPTMGGVKFARGGGEAMSLAVRIARTHTKRDKVAFSGYHGWTDWYLATNLSSESNLDEHLLPGLEPSGVPSGLSGTAIPFKYNDTDDFKRLFEQHSDIGVIVIEGARHDLPSADFLKAIDIESKKRGIVVIVDEITSGLRVSESGVYRMFNFEPDIAVYGKALGNGFAISAVVGKKNVMDSAQDTFVSSTMWTERVGFAAGLATLNKLTDCSVHKHLIEVGTHVGNGWEELARKHTLDISITNYKPLITFKLNYGEANNPIATLFIQEMLKRGYLASTSLYVTYAHTIEIANKYLKNVDKVFEIMADAINNNKVLDLLETEVRTDMFKRLN